MFSDMIIYADLTLWERMLNSFQVTSWIWWLSQVFALIALVCFIWSFQIKDKIKMMLMIGHASTSLVVSAAILGNFSLTVLFGLAAIRNYVFSYTDWRKKKGKHVAKWVPLMFAGIFAAMTITTTVLFLTVFSVQFEYIEGYGYALNLAQRVFETSCVPTDYYFYVDGIRQYFTWSWSSNHYVYVDGIRHYVYLTRSNGGNMTANVIRSVPIFRTGVAISFVWVEILICATLIGLIIGNILPGTLVMRCSFIGNRLFNIINHVFFGNAIGVVIATMAIGSNVLYYVRGWIKMGKERKLKKCGCEAGGSENFADGRILSPELVIKKEVVNQFRDNRDGKSAECCEQETDKTE